MFNLQFSVNVMHVDMCTYQQFWVEEERVHLASCYVMQCLLIWVCARLVEQKILGSCEMAVEGIHRKYTISLSPSQHVLGWQDVFPATDVVAK